MLTFFKQGLSPPTPAGRWSVRAPDAGHIRKIFENSIDIYRTGVYYEDTPKGKRLALPNAEIMIHQPSAGTQGQITDMAIHLKRLEVVKKRMNRILSENTGKAIEVVTADCERDNFMTAQEAVEYGLIDKVIEHR